MQIYFAPLEGITGYIYRNAYEDYFGGIDRYYSPFVVTRDGGIMKNKEKNDILPERNSRISLVPQLLSSHAEISAALLGRWFQRAGAQVSLAGWMICSAF